MKFLESQDVQSSIAFEVASDDLIKIYQAYNAQPIEINGDLFDF